MGRDNEVTIRWDPAHHKITSNEEADKYVNAAAGGEAPCSEAPDEYRWENSLSYMARTAIEARPAPRVSGSPATWRPSDDTVPSPEGLATGAASP